MTRPVLARAAAFVILVAAGTRPVAAADLRNVLAGYTVTAWVQADGLPPGVIWTIAQDRGGYLWLGTDAGLFRFDGVRFVAWESDEGTTLPRAPVRSLIVAKDGSLWLGFGEPGGVSRIRDGRAVNFSESDGLGLGMVTMLFEDPAGNIWAGSNRGGFYRFDGDLWTTSGAGLPKGINFYSAHVDRIGNFYVTTASGTFVKAPGSDTFRDAEGFDRVVRHLVQDGAETVWVSDPVVGFRKLKDPRLPTSSAEKGQGSRLLFDSKGHLWVGTFGQGLWRVAFDGTKEQPTIEKTSTLTGFSTDGVNSLLEDREGNIWAATFDGLNRLTPHKITPVMSLGVIRGVEQSPDGRVWIGAVDALIEFMPGEIEPRRRPRSFNGAPPSAMHTDERGVLWVATTDGLLRSDGGPLSDVRFPEEKVLRRITAIASDRAGGVWLYDREHSVVRWNSERVDAMRLPASLQEQAVMCSLTDRTGRLWLSFEKGAVAVIEPDGKTRVYGRQDGLAANVYRVLYEDQRGTVWLGGINGLSWSTADRFASLSAANGFPDGSIVSIVDDRSGGLWLGLEGVGIIRINRKEIEELFGNHEHRLRFSFYDKFDGFAGAPRWFGNSSATRGEDGRLWVLSQRGATVIDPAKLPEDDTAPLLVEIERVVADSVRIAAVSPARLPTGTARVEVEYTVATLTTPLKTRFRYRLDGFDSDWIDAGNRRQAFYTNLPPRDYRFRVSASNADGTWSEPSADVVISIPPRFYQTTWFSMLCVSLAGLAAWGAWRLRIRQVRKQFALLLAERGRLGREIHDTLLQGLFGMALQCEAIANDLHPAERTVKDRLLKLQNDAEEYVREARNSIRDLRSPKLQHCDLVSALGQAGERATAGSSVAFKLTVNGEPYRFSATAEEQLLRVGQEALANAVRHAHAHEVRLKLNYQKTAVTMTVSDDGCGFDPIEFKSPNGHCGLVSMKERVEAVGGDFKIASILGRGTNVEATVPRSSRLA